MSLHERTLVEFLGLILVMLIMGLSIYAGYNLGQASSLTSCVNQRDVGKREVGRICTVSYQWEWDNAE